MSCLLAAVCCLNRVRRAVSVQSRVTVVVKRDDKLSIGADSICES